MKKKDRTNIVLHGVANLRHLHWRLLRKCTGTHVGLFFFFLSRSGTSHHGGYSHDAVVYALRHCGVRHVDTAKRYGCEEALSESIAESRVPRDELWLTTKLWPGDYGYRSAKENCRASCARLGVEYVDLYLMHWPDCAVPGRSNREVRAETWRALEEMYDEGRGRLSSYVSGSWICRRFVTLGCFFFL